MYHQLTITLGFQHHLKEGFSPNFDDFSTLRVQPWWLYENTHCLNGGWNRRD